MTTETALEAEPAEQEEAPQPPAGDHGSRGTMRRLGRSVIDRYALLAAMVLLVGIFSALRPDVFLTVANFTSMLGIQAPLAVLAIGVTVVLVSVFVPLAFVPGLTGQFYQQFALTIAISTVISAFNSLTLSPALAAVLLRSHDAPKDGFSRLLDKLEQGTISPGDQDSRASQMEPVPLTLRSRSPEASERARSSKFSGSTPNTSHSGTASLIAMATPAVRPPPP